MSKKRGGSRKEERKEGGRKVGRKELSSRRMRPDKKSTPPHFWGGASYRSLIYLALIA
tara:strand:- start:752 stop:925 length:174 start_codon:yes stop_codon:yes gene_type:complete